MICNKCGRETNMINDLCWDCQKELKEQDEHCTKSNQALKVECELRNFVLFVTHRNEDEKLNNLPFNSTPEKLYEDIETFMREVYERPTEKGVCVSDEELPEETELSGRLEAVEKLRELYQNLQDTKEEGKEVFVHEYLVKFEEAVCKLLEFESRP